MKVLNPSSYHMNARSLLATSIGIHMCPISCAITLYSLYTSLLLFSIAIIGYSMPLIGPSMAEMCGHGYWNHRAEYF